MSKRKELQARQQAESRKKTLQIGGIIAVLAVVLIGGAIALNQVAPNTALTPSVPLPAVQLSGKPVPPNAEPNGLAWGPKDAPIKIEEYIDYQCPACASQWSQNEEAIIAALAATGKVRYEYNFLTFQDNNRAGSSDSKNAATGALCAAEQNKFWEFHNTLFANQIATNRGQYSLSRLNDMVTKIGGADAAAFTACMTSGKYDSRINEMASTAQARGVQSTPTFFVNDKAFPGTQTLANLRDAIAQVAPSVTLP
jgi:protein-disulfide isomerase